MDNKQLIRAVEDLKKTVDTIYKDLNLEVSKKTLNKLENQTLEHNFWDHKLNAQDVLKKIAKLKAKLDPWEEVRIEINEILELAILNDKYLLNELNNKFIKVNKKYTKLKKDLRFKGKYDDYEAILNIYAGAGGTDAQDWTAMLLRMYIRWAEKSKHKVKIISQNEGDEAGIKSVSLEVSGKFTYGLLKSENGVHRLVRLSPFNSDNLRQTSFARVEILPLIEKDDQIKIEDNDLKIDVFRSGGHGGQSVNTTDSAVRITHISTGITVTIQNERSQLQNKELALTILRSKLLKLSLEQHNKKLDSLKSPNYSAEWGNQIRSYILHPYKQVKDLRTGYTTTEVDKILNGEITPLMNTFIDKLASIDQTT